MEIIELFWWAKCVDITRFIPNSLLIERSREMKMRSAFTLFEVVVVALILGIMAAYAAPRIIDHFQTKTKSSTTCGQRSE